MRASFLSILLGFSGWLIAAQVKPVPKPPADDGAFFRTGTRLIQVDVVVRSKDGPIAGLTKSDFELLDNGKPQNIAVFSVRKNGLEEPVTQALPPGVVSSRPVQNTADPLEYNVIVLAGLTPANDYLGKMLKRDHSHSLIAVYSLRTKLTLVQPFTSDRDKIINSIQKAEGLVPGLDKATLDELASWKFAPLGVNYALLKKTAFVALLHNLKGLPGRKKLIWVGLDTLPVYVGLDYNRMPHGKGAEPFTPAEATKMLNDANVGYYPIDVRGPGFSTLRDNTFAAMRTVSEKTGGSPFYLDNGIDFGFEEAVHYTDLTYTLGFYQPLDAVDGEQHSIKVNVLAAVAREDKIKEIRYRTSYTAEPKRAPLTSKEREGTLNALVLATLDQTELSLQARATPSAKQPGYYDVDATLDIRDLQMSQRNDRWVGSFDVVVTSDAEKKSKGFQHTVKLDLTQEKYLSVLETGFTLSSKVRMTDDKDAPLARELRVVVMDDNTGKAGSVRIPVEMAPVGQMRPKFEQREPR